MGGREGGNPKVLLGILYTGFFFYIGGGRGGSGCIFFTA